MRKNYIYLVLFFLLAFSSFAQKVTVTPTLVNGSAFGGTINLGGVPYSSISLGVKVDMPTIPDNNGTVTVYVVSGLNPVVAIGGSSLPLFFGGAKTASQSFVINIAWGSISTTGSYIYADYKTSSGIVYKSGYVSVTKNTTMNGGTPQAPADAPDPSKIANTLCCNQTIRLGDKPALITGSQYLNPYEKDSYGINASWAANGNPNIKFLNLDNANKTLAIDYVNELGSFTITRGLGYNSKNDFPNKSNTVTITVVPSPILSNNIGVTNASAANSDDFVEFSSLKSVDITGTVSFVDINMFKDPTHVYQRTDDLSYDAVYTWEYTKVNKNNLSGSRLWIPIISNNPSNLYGFTPPNSNSEDNYYLVRRIASYKDISRVSNEVKIMTRGMGQNNTICCDQSLKIQSLTQYDSPITINGSIPTLDSNSIQGTNLIINSISYQWQVQTGLRGISAWTDIANATNKDYLPTQQLKVIENNRARSYTFEAYYNYRRIVKFNYQVIINGTWNSSIKTSYSNEISLEGNSNTPYMMIYPNPTSSILNIQSTTDITNSKITVTNIIGNTYTYNHSVINPNLISIDVSQLPRGTYFINIENRDVFQKTFIKQ